MAASAANIEAGTKTAVEATRPVLLIKYLLSYDNSQIYLNFDFLD